METTGKTRYNAGTKIEFPDKLWTINLRETEAVEGPEKDDKTELEKP
jgi:hypothetical protein